jgi:hypothetical protein
MVPIVKSPDDITVIVGGRRREAFLLAADLRRPDPPRASRDPARDGDPARPIADLAH